MAYSRPNFYLILKQELLRSSHIFPLNRKEIFFKRPKICMEKFLENFPFVKFYKSTYLNTKLNIFRIIVGFFFLYRFILANLKAMYPDWNDISSKLCIRSARSWGKLENHNSELSVSRLVCWFSLHSFLYLFNKSRSRKGIIKLPYHILQIYTQV